MLKDFSKYVSVWFALHFSYKVKYLDNGKSGKIYFNKLMKMHLVWITGLYLS